MRTKNREVFEKTNIPEAENLSLLEVGGGLQLYLNKHPKRSKVLFTTRANDDSKGREASVKAKKYCVTATPRHYNDCNLLANAVPLTSFIS